MPNRILGLRPEGPSVLAYTRFRRRTSGGPECRPSPSGTGREIVPHNITRIALHSIMSFDISQWVKTSPASHHGPSPPRGAHRDESELPASLSLSSSGSVPLAFTPRGASTHQRRHFPIKSWRMLASVLVRGPAGRQIGLRRSPLHPGSRN